MIDDIASLTEAWEVKLSTVAVPATGTPKVLGANPARWIVYFQTQGAIIGNPTLLPWSPNSSISFSLNGMTTPTRFSQKDDGPLPAGEWYVSTGGGGFNLLVAELIWKG